MNDEIRNSLNDLLNSEEDIEQEDSKQLATLPTNFPQISAEAKYQAKKLMSGLLKFYLSEDFIDTNEYIKAKTVLDTMTVEGLIKQVKYAENAIENMLRKIDSGEQHPRVFEVFSGLQKTYIDLLKTQTLYLISTEEHLKKLKNDHDFYDKKSNTKKLNGDSVIFNSDETKTVRGTRDLLKSLKNEVEDIEILEENNE